MREADAGICEADTGISDIDNDTGVSVAIGVLVDDDVDEEGSVSADIVSNSCLRVACRVARGKDSSDAILIEERICSMEERICSREDRICSREDRICYAVF